MGGRFSPIRLHVFMTAGSDEDQRADWSRDFYASGEAMYACRRLYPSSGSITGRVTRYAARLGARLELTV